MINCYYITLEKKLYTCSGLSKSNFEDHYGDVVMTQCLGKIAEINEFSASGEMLWVTRQSGHQQVDCSKVEGRHVAVECWVLDMQSIPASLTHTDASLAYHLHHSHSQIPSLFYSSTSAEILTCTTTPSHHRLTGSDSRVQKSSRNNKVRNYFESRFILILRDMSWHLTFYALIPHCLTAVCLFSIKNWLIDWSIDWLTSAIGLSSVRPYLIGFNARLVRAPRSVRILTEFLTEDHSVSQLPNKFHGHFATSLEYVILLIRWSLGCVFFK